MIDLEDVNNSSNREQNGTYSTVEADYAASMGVFMTASEANRQRVLRLLRFERDQMWAQFTSVDKESPAVKRGKPPMSETRQLWSSDPSSCNIRSASSRSAA